VLLHEGRPYDSKAIVGVAHGHLSGRSVLTTNEFAGGELTVQKILTNLGFKVIGPDAKLLPTPGEVLTNEEIGYRFAVGNMGGMRRSTKYNLLALISDPFKGLYQDRWDGDVIHYTGMGPTGDQNVSYAQNKTLSESRHTKIPMHLLEALSPQKYTYVGEVELADDPYQEEQLGDAGQTRKVWMFPLRPKQGAIVPELQSAQVKQIEESQARIARRLSIDELKKRAKKAKGTPSARAARIFAYPRNAAVTEYAKRLANGFCDLCEMPAPFHNKENEAYLECHHVIWLANGGKDIIDNTVALCPNCHRKMHIMNHQKDREKLSRTAAARSLL
jgi:5-methylcytosine-specific restriction protein A